MASTRWSNSSWRTATPIVGSSLGDVFLGKAGDDVISGLSGADRLFGETGGDTLYGGDHDDQLFGGPGDDYLFGEAGNDAIYAGGGINQIDGGAGTDSVSFANSTAPVRVTLNGAAASDVRIGIFDRGTLKNVENIVGGDGNDTVTGDGFSNVLQGLNGDDTLNGGDNDDRLLGSAGNNSLHGDNGNDELLAGSGEDLLDGGLGSDIMEGGSGNDTYVVDYTGDTVTELAGNGDDTVLSSATYALAANVENLTLTGDAVIDATGNGIANTIVGNAAANRLDGHGDADRMTGGPGDDTYIVDDVADTVTENAGEGHDRIDASASFVLGYEVEDLLLAGTGNISGIGNALANAITGNSGNNMIAGGLGRDILAGGSGADSFVFDFKAGKANADTILDFKAGVDHLVLDDGVFRKMHDGGVLKAKFLAFGKADDGNDYLVYREGSGKLFYDRDGDGDKAAKLVAILKGAPDLDGGDILIA